MTTLLDIDNLTKRYRSAGGVLGMRSSSVTALGGVSLGVQQGETLGLVGESGCGKSTLARLVLALEKPDHGQVRYNGQPLFPTLPADYRSEAQMVFQDPYSSLNPRRSVGATIGEPLVTFGLGSRAERKDRVHELLAQVGLAPEHADRYPHEFSGGQRQRIAVARALAPSPKLMVLDEAVSALDVSIQAQILGLLEQLKTDLGLTYIFISHDLSVVHHVSDRVAVMYLGKLVELAPRDALYESPRHPYTQKLLSAVPVPDPRRRLQPVDKTSSMQDFSKSRPETGCPFEPRCAQAQANCRQSDPALDEIAPNHWVACFHSS